ncbi:hypothetical protein D3C76_655330 [compost metagenome]
MCRHWSVFVTLTLAKQQTGGKRSYTGVDVNCSTTSEIQHAPVVHQCPCSTPYHVGHWRVDKGEPDGHEQQRRRELHTFGKSPGNERRSDDGKGHLEGNKHPFRNVANQAFRRHACQKCAVQAADKAIEANLALNHVGGIDHHAVAINHPQHPHQSGDTKTLGEQ